MSDGPLKCSASSPGCPCLPNGRLCDTKNLEAAFELSVILFAHYNEVKTNSRHRVTGRMQRCNDRRLLVSFVNDRDIIKER